MRPHVRAHRPPETHTIETSILVRGRRYPIRITKRGDRIEATADVATPYGVVCVSASAELAPIRAAIGRMARSQFGREVRKMIAVGEDPALIGSAWDDFKGFFYKTVPKEAKKVGRNKVFRKVAEGINGVTDSPAYNIAMAAVNVIPGYGQAISAGMAATKMAAGGLNLLARSSEGEPKAKGAIKAIAKAAKKGNPKAQKALGVLKALNKMPALQKGAKLDSATGYPVAMQALDTAQGLAEQYIPGMADSKEYQAMKAIYGAGRGIADMAMSGYDPGYFEAGYYDVEDDDDLSPIEGMTVLDLVAGADGVYRLPPQGRRKAKAKHRVKRHRARPPAPGYRVHRRFYYGLPPPHP